MDQDADLVRRTLEGQSEAFGALVEKYQGLVHGLAFGQFHQVRCAGSHSIPPEMIGYDEHNVGTGCALEHVCTSGGNTTDPSLLGEDWGLGV